MLIGIINFFRSPLKSKKTKSFKFATKNKEKREKSREKLDKEKKDKPKSDKKEKRKNEGAEFEGKIARKNIQVYFTSHRTMGHPVERYGCIPGKLQPFWNTREN